MVQSGGVDPPAGNRAGRIVRRRAGSLERAGSGVRRVERQGDVSQPFESVLHLVGIGELAGDNAAISLYREALERDPTFALASARLSFNESLLAWYGGAGTDVRQLGREARADAERALALQPDLAAARMAVGYSDYYGRGDYAAALDAFAASLRLSPNDADALAAQGHVQRRVGRFDAAIASLQQALSLDPRNSALAHELGMTCMGASRYAEATRAFRRAMALDPNNHNARIWYAQAIELVTGDVPRALAAVQGDDPELKIMRVTLLGDERRYRDALALLDAVPDTPDNFGGGGKALARGQLYSLMGDPVRARTMYAEALPRVRAQLDVQQGIQLSGASQAVAGAELGLGHTAQGLAAIARAQAIVNAVTDRTAGPDCTLGVARLYAVAKRPDLAVPVLSQALSMPGVGAYYSPMWLWLDPVWDPIRNDPRFRVLLKEYGRYRPAVAHASAPAVANK